MKASSSSQPQQPPPPPPPCSPVSELGASLSAPPGSFPPPPGRKPLPSRKPITIIKRPKLPRGQAPSPDETPGAASDDPTLYAPGDTVHPGLRAASELESEPEARRGALGFKSLEERVRAYEEAKRRIWTEQHLPPLSAEGAAATSVRTSSSTAAAAGEQQWGTNRSQTPPAPIEYEVNQPPTNWDPHQPLLYGQPPSWLWQGGGDNRGVHYMGLMPPSSAAEYVVHRQPPPASPPESDLMWRGWAAGGS